MSSSSEFAAPSIALLCKLGSLVVHVDELLGPTGSQFDENAIRGLLSDPDVVAFLERMDERGLLPKRR